MNDECQPATSDVAELSDRNSGGNGALPQRFKSSAQGVAAARRQHPGPVQPGDLHVAVAALAGAELSLPSHLRTMRALKETQKKGPSIIGRFPAVEHRYKTPEAEQL